MNGNTRYEIDYEDFTFEKVRHALQMFRKLKAPGLDSLQHAVLPHFIQLAAERLTEICPGERPGWPNGQVLNGPM